MSEMIEIWQKVLDIVKVDMIPVSFSTWIETIIPVEMSVDTFKIEVPHIWAKQMIETFAVGFEDEIDEDAVKAGLREYIKNNSESLKAHGVYLSDELAVLLEKKGESLSDYIDEYELDSDVLDELKEKYAEDADFAALIDNLQEKIDDSIFVAQIDVESDYETAIENICEVIDVNNGYLVAADGESEVALTAYADALAANVPQVIEVDSTDIESLDVTMNNLACLPGQNEDEFESRRESIIDELDGNSRKTSKRLAKLMAKVGIKKYADHKDEYETKFKSYESSSH